MLTLLALYLASISHPALGSPKLVGHCYSSESDFNPRVIKISKVLSDEYEYFLFSQSEWFGPLKNFKESIEINYTKDVNCPK